MVELTLYGKFREIPDILFSRRMHPQASSWDRKDSDRQRNFWDPSQRKLVMQTWRSQFEYHRAVAKAPISLAQKTSIVYYLVKNAYWVRNTLSRELMELIRHGVPKTRMNRRTQGEK